MGQGMRERLQPFGIWLSRRLLPGPAGEQRDVATGIEDLGIGALWLGGSPPAGLEQPEELLAGTTDLIVGTSILNIWTEPAADVAASRQRLRERYGDRFVLGIGVGHAPAAERAGLSYTRPLERMGAWLDELDASDPTVPVDRRMIAALGPRALRLAADRTAGTLPYLTTPAHTRQARETVGPDRLVVPEHTVVLETDAQAARAVARQMLAGYLTLPNYLNSWRRLGFGEEDFADGGSDALVDAVVAHGDPDQITAGLQAHLDAGADQVAVQVLRAGGGLPREEWKRLAPVLTAARPR